MYCIVAYIYSSYLWRKQYSILLEGKRIEIHKCIFFVLGPHLHSIRAVHQINEQLQVSLSIIQIKICAEYRDMLPRARLVCQEPGLRPIGRSPGVLNKSSRGLGSMSRYSAQILICFIAYILHFFIPLWVWLGILQDCHLPLSIVIRMRLVIRQSKLPACLAEVQLAHVNNIKNIIRILFIHSNIPTGIQVISLLLPVLYRTVTSIVSLPCW